MRCLIHRSLKATKILAGMAPMGGLPTGLVEAEKMSLRDSLRFEARIRRAEQAGRAIDETLTYPVLVMSEAERLFRQQQSLTSAGKGQSKSRQMRRARQTHKGKRFGQF